MNPLSPYYFNLGLFLILMVVAHELSFVFNKKRDAVYAGVKCLALIFAVICFGFNDIGIKNKNLAEKNTETKQDAGSTIAEELKSLNEEISALRIKSEMIEAKANNLTQTLNSCRRSVAEKEEAIIRIKEEEDAQ